MSSVKINDTWRDIDKIWCCISGLNKPVTQAWVNINGVWREFFRDVLYEKFIILYTIDYQTNFTNLGTVSVTSKTITISTKSTQGTRVRFYTRFLDSQNNIVSKVLEDLGYTLRINWSATANGSGWDNALGGYLDTDRSYKVDLSGSYPINKSGTLDMTTEIDAYDTIYFGYLNGASGGSSSQTVNYTFNSVSIIDKVTKQIIKTLPFTFEHWI